ncbi:MAG: cytochrome [Pseudomonadales bacterium]|nr:cytochrome [Pseudomonadales bacterium]
MAASNFEERDYFTDPSVLLDPYGYFDEMRQRGPVVQLETRDALLVNGFKEYLEVALNTKDWSAINGLAGSGTPLPFTPEGSDISAQLEANRDKFIGHELVVCYDGKKHKDVRSLISRCFTPSRLKANETFMKEYAGQLIDQAVAKGRCELMGEISTRFVTLVIADLLGVPPEDRVIFEEQIEKGQTVGSIENADNPTAMESVYFIGGYMAKYLAERSENPGSDLMSELATATYPDGTKPEMLELVTLATFMFVAGQDTSAKLLGNVVRYICDVPGLQQEMRADRELIPWVIEEVLRLEGSTKATHRLAIRDTTIGDRPVPAGTQAMLGIAGVNRDPERWGDDANEFKLKRPRIREHLAFGRGVHTCAGAPLARAEVLTMLNVMLDKTSEIRISEQEHGKPGSRQYPFEPSFIIRGLEKLHVELDPK